MNLSDKIGKDDVFLVLVEEHSSLHHAEEDM